MRTVVCDRPCAYQSVRKNRPTVPLTEGQRALVADNIRLVYYVLAKSYAHVTPSHPRREEIESAAVFGLCMAAQRYTEGRGTAFSTYACHYIWGYVMSEWNRARPRAVAIDPGAVVVPCHRYDSTEAVSALDGALRDKARVRAALARIPAADAKLLRARFGFTTEPLTLSDLAGRLKVSKTCVINRMDRALDRFLIAYQRAARVA